MTKGMIIVLTCKYINKFPSFSLKSGSFLFRGEDRLISKNIN